jgi:para-nitrobenzyl esterase
MLQRTTFAPANEAALLAEMTRCVGEELASALLHAYRKLEPEASLARLRTRFLTDWIYRIPAVRCAEAQIASGGQAWSYLFAHAPSPLLGAHHGADIAYTLDMLGQPSALAPADTVENQQVRNIMVEAWATFARTGNPGWPMYQSGQPTVRCIGEMPELIVEPPPDVAHLWREF